jgi:hypothetical protein
MTENASWHRMREAVDRRLQYCWKDSTEETQGPSIPVILHLALSSKKKKKKKKKSPAISKYIVVLCWLVLCQLDTNYSHLKGGNLNASIKSGHWQTCRAFS